jgi:hypothetical protein
VGGTGFDKFNTTHKGFLSPHDDLFVDECLRRRLKRQRLSLEMKSENGTHGIICEKLPKVVIDDYNRPLLFQGVEV